MSSFSYKATNANKEVSSGTITAKDRDEAAQMLQKQGLSPLVVKETTQKLLVRGSVPPIERITFCKYLSTMLTSGLSLSEGIDVLRDETKNKVMKQILSDMNYSLEQGQQLSQVFERYPDVFEDYFLTLVRAGEVSGKLADVLKYLEHELRAEYSLKGKVKGAMLYPTIVFLAMIGIGTMMFFFALPQIGKVFLSLRLPLPAPTRFLFESSIYLSKFAIPILLGGIVFGAVSLWAIKKRAVRTLLFYLIKPIPLVRNLIKKVDFARFNRIFSTLIKSAVPITEALEIALKTLSWYEFETLATTMPQEIRKGKSLSSLIRGNKVFPSLMSQMIAAGEKTGTLDVALADLATFYEQEVEEELKNLAQTIEPVLMLLVGIGVGVMILSIIAPIYSVVGNFQQAASGPVAPR